MLSDDKPKIYWDACVPLSYINGYENRLPDIEGLMDRSGRDFYLVTSILSIVEVAFAQTEFQQTKLDEVQEARIAKLWQLNSPIQMIEFYELLAQKARHLMRAAIPEGWSLKPADAIHLATADHLKVSKFHTYDDRLDKFKKITETHFDIERPTAAQPVLILSDSERSNAPEIDQETAEEPSPSANIEEESKQDDSKPDSAQDATGPSAEASNQHEADPAHSASVRGSDEGRTEGETAGKAPEDPSQISEKAEE